MLRLIEPDLGLIEAAITGDDALERALGCPVVPGWATFPGALESVRGQVASDGSKWGPRFFIDDALVGWGGFKGAPSRGTVELGYEIAASHRGRGLATQAVRAMLSEAFGYDEVTHVIAHTLAQRNASNRVLEKAGFVYDRELQQGKMRVFRFSLRRA